MCCALVIAPWPAVSCRSHAVIVTVHSVGQFQSVWGVDMSLHKLLDKIDGWYEHIRVYVVIYVTWFDVGDCTVGGDEHEPKLVGTRIVQNLVQMRLSGSIGPTTWRAGGNLVTTLRNA